MRVMLKHWLQTAVDPRPTWEAVVKALKSPLVNEMKLAAELEHRLEESGGITLVVCCSSKPFLGK